AVLDLGASKVAGLTWQMAAEPAADGAPDIGLRTPSIGAFRVIGAATTRSRGVDFGEIVAMDETERAIRTAVQGAQKMARTRADHVMVCFSGGRPRSYGVDGNTEVENGEVLERDIGHLLATCDIPDYGADRDVIHAMPVNFTLDKRTGLSDPRGQVGTELSVDMHILTVSAQSVQNLLHCIHRCDLELAGLAISSFVSGVSSLVEDEQELGAACIDLGGGTTGVSVFLKRQMIFADTVRLGGDHITRDICQGLQIPMSVAERIKSFNGGVIATGMDDRDMIEVPSPLGDWEHERRQISRSELIGVIRPRMEEIFDEVRARLDAAGFEYLASQRIVLTGGGSQMPGLETLAARYLGPHVRIGRPLRVQGLPQAATGSAFSAAVGLALYISHPQDECWDFEVPADSRGGRRVRQAMRWFRDNW
ncbi:MAG: cell division protein FtsA, partial [Paracoccaceae bacterium]